MYVKVVPHTLSFFYSFCSMSFIDVVGIPLIPSTDYNFMIEVNYKGKVKEELGGQQGNISKGNLSPILKLRTVRQIHS